MNTFTIVMTTGAYVVNEEYAEQVLAAVERRDPHVLVEADLLGDGLYHSPIRIVTAHVTAVVKNDHPEKRRDALYPIR